MPDNHSINYVETDAPAGLTLIEWRQSRRSAPRRQRRRLRLRTFVPAQRPAFA